MEISIRLNTEQKTKEDIHKTRVLHIGPNLEHRVICLQLCDIWSRNRGQNRGRISSARAAGGHKGERLPDELGELIV